MRKSLLALSLLFLFSCKTSKDAYRFTEPQALFISQDRVEMDILLLEDNPAKHIFQIEINNRSDNTLFLSQEEVALQMRIDEDEILTETPIPKSSILLEAYTMKEKAESDFKSERTANWIVSGLGVLSGLLIGAPVISIESAADGAIYGAGNNRNQKRYAKDLDEYIQAIETFVLDTISLAPGRSRSFDVHFHKIGKKSRGQLEFTHPDFKFYTEERFLLARRRK